MNNIPVDESIIEEGAADEEEADDQMEVDDEPDSNDGPPGEEWDGIEDGGDAAMDDDDDTPAFFKEAKAASASAAVQKTPSKRPKTKVAAVVREKIRKVLEDVTGLAEKRSRYVLLPRRAEPPDRSVPETLVC